MSEAHSGAGLSEAVTERADPVTRVAAQQRLRERRLLMAAGSYSATLGLVAYFYYAGLISARVAQFHFMIVLGLNVAFFAAIRSGWNLRFRDPSLTFVQAAASILPALYVLWFLEQPQARMALTYLAVIPALFGAMALDTRRLLYLNSWVVASYGVLVAGSSVLRPERLSPFTEGLLIVPLVIVLLQVSLLAGYLSRLRTNLRERNAELRSALARLNELAVRDGLTGAYNRRYLMDAVSSEINRAQRAGSRFSVAIVDIDHFKAINDRHGHQAGDAALKRVVAVMRTSLREADSFGRWGGEEFLMLLPDTPAAGAAVTAERVRRCLSSITLPEIAADLHVTASIGIAEWRPDESLNRVIARADQALYRAKGAGRDAVEIDMGPVPES